MALYEVKGEIPPMSYNEFMEVYGGTYEDFSIHSLAFMLQQQRDTLDQRTITKWESQLKGTRYEIC